MIEISKDTLWKGIIEDLFDDFLLYFFSQWATQNVNFLQKFEFLDKELDSIYPERQNQKRYADKLVKVFTKNGTELWILVHIEIQGYKDEDFAERMFTYFYRIKDRFRKNVMALAIFTDDSPDFQPSEYVYQYQKTHNTYRFETFKILNKTEAELYIPQNPFSIVMLTAKKALEKANLEDNKQLVWKKELILALKEANYSNQKIRNILNFIRFYVKFNHVSSLEELNQNIQITFKQRKNMGIEQAILQEIKETGIQEGKMEGKIEGIKKSLKRGKLTLEEIAEDFDVTLDFVLKIQKGEVS